MGYILVDVHGVDVCWRGSGGVKQSRRRYILCGTECGALRWAWLLRARDVRRGRKTHEAGSRTRAGVQKIITGECKGLSQAFVSVYSCAGDIRGTHLRNPSARAPQNAWARCWCEIRWCRASESKGHMEEGERAKAHRRAGCLHRDRLRGKDVEGGEWGERLCQGPSCRTSAVRNESKAVMGQRGCYPRVEAAAHEGDASAYYIEGVVAALTGRKHR